MSNIQTSSELQEIVLSSILKDPYMLGKVKDDIQVQFFERSSYKLIYKSLLYYYNKYSQIPTLQSLSLTINDLYITEYGSKDDIINDLVALYNTPINNEDFVIDQITRFIKRHRVEDVLSTYLPKIKNGENISIDKLGDELSDSVSVDLHQSKAFILSDLNSLSEVRRDAVGSESNPTIIKSKFPAINSALLYKGYKIGDLVAVVARPGCFTGDTRIMTNYNSSITLEELYNNQEKNIMTYSSDLDGTPRISIAEGVYLSKYVDELVEVEVDNQYVIKCTLDHPFLLKSGKYVKAEDLKVLDELTPMHRRIRTKDFMHGYEEIYNPNYDYWTPTHYESFNYKDEEFLGEGYHRHHDDLNKLNNHPNNIVQLLKHDHLKLHWDHGTYEKFVENGKATRFNSERTSQMNKENWKDPKYRERMKKIQSETSKNSKLVTELNYNSDFQKDTRRGKVLSYINFMIHKFSKDSITIDNFERLSYSINEYKHHVGLEGIAEAFDCTNRSNRRVNSYTENNDGTFECKGCHKKFNNQKSVKGHTRNCKIYRELPKQSFINYDKLNELWDSIIEEAVLYNHKITNVNIIKLDDKVPVYGLYNVDKYHNYTICLGDSNDDGIVVSNSGKTMFMVNELRNAAMMGHNVLHLFIGDMTKYDGFIRYASGFSGVNQDEIVEMNEEDQKLLVEKCNFNGNFDRVAVEAYAAGQITINQMIDDVFKIQDNLKTHFDMIAVDYPDNLIHESDMMYESGGKIYDKLSYLARRNKCVVIVGSQPKQNYWDSEIIPLDGLAESSRKQQILDLLITLGKPTNDCPLLTGFLAKVRRGTVGGIFRTKTEFEKADMNQISEPDYFRIKAEYDGSGVQ